MTLVEFLTDRLDEDEATARDERVEDIPGDCWGPKRILREVEAKRRIVGRHEEVPVAPGRPETTCVEDGWIDGWPCPTLRHLASVYADHPDYDGAWRP